MEINAPNDLVCFCCKKSSYTESDKFCGTCGYPLQGTEEEQRDYRVNYTTNNYDKGVAASKIKQAKVILFVIAGFTGLWGLISYFVDNDLATLIANFILSAIYLGLGFWAKKKAFPAILTGGLLYVSLILLNAFVDPKTIIQGILFKVLFISAFIKGSYGAYKFKIS